MINEHVYLLREREFIKTRENIYKIGGTVGPILARMCGYPKGSELLYVIPVKKYKVVENKIKELFGKKFIQRVDIGSEYFEGDVEEMIEIYHNLMSDIKDDEIVNNRCKNIFKLLKQFVSFPPLPEEPDYNPYDDVKSMPSNFVYSYYDRINVKKLRQITIDQLPLPLNYNVFFL